MSCNVTFHKSQIFEKFTKFGISQILEKFKHDNLVQPHSIPKQMIKDKLDKL